MAPRRELLNNMSRQVFAGTCFDGTGEIAGVAAAVACRRNSDNVSDMMNPPELQPSKHNHCDRISQRPAA
jgi:hypothetical protein